MEKITHIQYLHIYTQCSINLYFKSSICAHIKLEVWFIFPSRRSYIVQRVVCYTFRLLPLLNKRVVRYTFIDWQKDDCFSCMLHFYRLTEGLLPLLNKRDRKWMNSTSGNSAQWLPQQQVGYWICLIVKIVGIAYHGDLELWTKTNLFF